MFPPSNSPNENALDADLFFFRWTVNTNGPKTTIWRSKTGNGTKCSSQRSYGNGRWAWWNGSIGIITSETRYRLNIVKYSNLIMEMNIAGKTFLSARISKC